MGEMLISIDQTTIVILTFVWLACATAKLTWHRWPTPTKLWVVDRVCDLTSFARRATFEWMLRMHVRWNLTSIDQRVIPLTGVPGYNHAFVTYVSRSSRTPGELHDTERDSRLISMFYKTADPPAAADLGALMERVNGMNTARIVLVILFLTEKYPINTDGTIMVDSHRKSKFIELTFGNNLDSVKGNEIYPARGVSPLRGRQVMFPSTNVLRPMASSTIVQSSIKLEDISLDTILPPILEKAGTDVQILP